MKDNDSVVFMGFHEKSSRIARWRGGEVLVNLLVAVQSAGFWTVIEDNRVG